MYGFVFIALEDLLLQELPGSEVEGLLGLQEGVALQVRLSFVILEHSVYHQYVALKAYLLRLYLDVIPNTGCRIDIIINQQFKSYNESDGTSRSIWIRIILITYI